MRYCEVLDAFIEKWNSPRSGTVIEPSYRSVPGQDSVNGWQSTILFLELNRQTSAVSVSWPSIVIVAPTEIVSPAMALTATNSPPK